MKKRFKNKNWKTGYEKFSLFYGQKNVNLLDMYGWWNTISHREHMLIEQELTFHSVIHLSLIIKYP